MPERQPLKVLKRVVTVCLIIAMGVTVVLFWPERAGYEDPNVMTAPIAEEEPEPEPVSVSSRVLFGGDVYWGRLFERNAPMDYAFPFSKLSTLDKEQYDAWIVNVECPITDEFVSFEVQWEAIQFNCKPEYLKEAAKWFDVVSLANNHTDNVRGQEGLDITRTNLEAAGIQHFGHYEPGVLEDLCEVVSLPAAMTLDDGSEEEIQLPVAMCGYHGVFRTFTDEEIAYMEKYTEHFITISMPHAGAEYQSSSDVFRETAYRAMVDVGADAVIGNHPHWVQNTEAYKGKLIVYSMGNFIFDQQFNAEVTRSAMIDMDISVEYTQELGAYLDAAQDCSAYKDDCLASIVESGASKPIATFAYDVVATRTTDLLTARDEAGLEAVKSRLNWEATLEQL